MLRFGKHVLTKSAVLASAVIVALSQQIHATAPSTGLQKAQAVIKTSPRSYEEYSLRADAYCELGQYQKQLDDLTSAIKMNPTVADLYERRADAYYQLWQLQNAIDDFTTATSLNPASSNACWPAAAAYEALGLYDKAVESRTRILRLDAKNAFAWSCRARDYELLRKFDLAQADWQKAIELAIPSERAKIQLWSPLIDFDHFSDEKTKDKIDQILKSDSVVLPFHYDYGGHLCVPVQVNGHPLQFILDTGSSLSDLWKQAMPGVARVDKVQLRTPNADGTESVSGLFRARKLELGNLTLSNVAMQVDEGPVGYKALSGFWGGNILENFVVTVDYVKKQVILANSFEQSRLKKAIIVPMILRTFRPHCTVSLDGKADVIALLDTGSPFNVSADSLLKPVLDKKLAFNQHIWGPWVGNLRTESVRLMSVKLGASNIESPIFQVFPADEAAAAAKEITLGNSFLSRFKTVTFDYPARQIILEPSETGSESAANLYCEGQFDFVNNDLRQAVDAFSKSMILDNEFAPICYQWRSIAFANLKQYRKALEDITAAIKLDPKHASNYGVRARVYEKLGQYRLQVADDTTAIRLAPQDQSAYINRAWAYDRLGKRQLAKRDRRMAQEFSRQ